MRAIDFEAWAAEGGVESGAWCDPSLHRSSHHVSQAARRAVLGWAAQQSEELAQRQIAARAEYDRLVAAGELRPLTTRERLQRTAEGHPDNPRTQAARRLLAIMGPAAE